MKRTKLYKLIIAILLIINIGMLVFFFLRRPPHGGPESIILASELGIEGAKAILITQLETAHHKEKKKLIDKDFELHETLFSKLGTEEDVSDIQAEIQVNQAEMERVTYEFFNEVSKHCSVEQKKQLKNMVYRAFHQMRALKDRR